MGSRITGKQVIGYKYFLTELMGLGVGPIDFVKKILIGDQTAWEGQLKDGETISISKPNLFGGKKGEGGVDGKVTLYAGANDQVIPTAVKSKINHDDATSVSDFRGTSNLWFDGMGCSMTWYPKPWIIARVRRQSGWDGEVWQPSLCEIDLTGTVSEEIVISTEQIVSDKEKYDIDDGDGHTGRYHNVTETIYAMNPAHILYQLFTDRTFGRGYSRDTIDEVSFLAAAVQLKAEGFGMCYRYNPAQKSVAEAVGDIITTIAAAVYPDRMTGLLTLKLIRDDYDPDLLPVYTRNSGITSIERAQVSASGSSVNELHVSYYSPISNSVRTVCRSNNASIISLGYKITNAVTYDGIPTAELAARVGDRDLRAQDPSVKRYTVKMDRRAWRVAPASVIKINDPPMKINNEILRVIDIKDTTLVDGTITLSVASDQFALPAETNAVDIVSDWHPPVNNPSAPSTYVVQEVSYRDAVLALGTDDALNLDRNVGTTITYVEQPNGSAESFSVNTSASGGDWDTDSDTAPFTEIASLASSVDEWSDTITIDLPEYMESVDIGSAVQIDNEVMRVDAESDDGASFTVARGCVDTIPATHTKGATVVFLDTGYLIDNTQYGLYETVKTRIITHTSTSSTDVALAPTVSLSITGRQGKPYPPANVKVNGKRFTDKAEVDGDMVVTWAPRNRIQSQDKLVSHTEDAQSPEADCVTYVGVYDGTKSLAYYSGRDTSWTWTKDQQIQTFADNPIGAGNNRTVTLKIGSRYQPSTGAQINSWQEYEIPVQIDSTAEYIKGNPVVLTATWHKASLRTHITGIGLSTQELTSQWFRANLRHHITGLGANAFVANASWKPATLKARPRFLAAPWEATATWHKATLAKHVVSGDRMLEDGSDWRVTEDDLNRDLES